MRSVFYLFVFFALVNYSLQVRDFIPKRYKIDDKTTLKHQLNFLRLFLNKTPAEDKTFLSSYDPTKDLQSNLVAQLSEQHWLEHRDIFNVHDSEHLKQAILLFNVFYHAKDVDALFKAAIWAKEIVNERLWSYSLSIALVHRADTFGLILPPIYEIRPHFFFNSEIINMAEEKYKANKCNLTSTIPVIKYDEVNMYINMDEEQLLTYFTEDIGLNSFYYMYHIFYPWWMDGKEFGLAADHRGELFYYIMAQSVARYNLERLSNGLGEAPAIDFSSTLDFSYYPGLQYPNGVAFPSRPEGLSLQKCKKDDYTRLQDFAFRIRNVVDLGRAYSGVDIYKEGVDGLEILSNLLEGNPNSPDLPYYGTLQIYAKHLIGLSPKPLNQRKAIPATIQHYETALRDPATWRFFRWLLSFYDDFYKHTKPYKSEELEYSGVSIDTVVADEVNTFFEEYNSDITTNVDAGFTAVISQKRLNSAPWKYNISVTSQIDGGALVKVFLGPKFDRFGKEMDIMDAHDKFYLIDHFAHNIKQGHNVIVRDQSEILFSDRISTKTLLAQLSEAITDKKEFIVAGGNAYWTFPGRLIFPRGTVSGLKCQLYIILTPLPNLDETMAINDVKYPRVGAGKHSALPYRFPIDRKPEVSLLVPNAIVTDITIRHVPYNS